MALLDTDLLLDVLGDDEVVEVVGGVVVLALEGGGEGVEGVLVAVGDYVDGVLEEGLGEGEGVSGGGLGWQLELAATGIGTVCTNCC